MDEEKRYEGTPEKKKKRKKRDGLSRRPVREKKERRFKLDIQVTKEKKELREKDGTCAGLTEE